MFICFVFAIVHFINLQKNPKFLKRSQIMKLTRRHFFKGVSAIIGMAGLDTIIGTPSAFATEPVSKVQGQVGVEWLGHGSFLFTSIKGKKILFDPWISTNPKCPSKYKQKGAFGKVDMILWTHGHVDHFMLNDAKSLIDEYNPKVIAPWELSFFIKSEIPTAKCETFSLGNKGGVANIDGIKITMLEAFHSAGAQLTGFSGANRFVGEAVGYMLTFENGLKIYHSGDTSLMGDMKTIIGDFYKPDVAILPIGGIFTMGPEEAAYACQLIRPKIMIPEHYGTFPVLVQSADSFKKLMKKQMPQTQVIIAGVGEFVNV